MQNCQNFLCHNYNKNQELNCYFPKYIFKECDKRKIFNRINFLCDRNDYKMTGRMFLVEKKKSKNKT